MNRFYFLRGFLPAIFICVFAGGLSGQTYNMATYNGQTVNTCSGTFTDGGGAGSYGNNENYTVTFCSSSGQPLMFDFSTSGSFDIDVPDDTLFFYDGTAATGTPIAILTYLDDNTQTGYSSQLKINTVSTCVTVVWKSNSAGTDAGWSAVISCGAPPTCASNPPAADIFGQATPVCNIANYCGTTAAYYGEDTPFNLIGGGVCPTPDDGIFGATIENNSWLKFEAMATSAIFDFTVSGGSCMSGIQAGVFSYNPTTHLFALKSPCALTDAGQTGTFSLTASSLTPGEVYYMMIDGYAGDNCDYTIAVNTGVNIVDAGPNQAVCDTFTTLAANSPMTAGLWTVFSGSGNFLDNTAPDTYVSGLSTGNNVFVWTSTSSFCGAVTDTVTINVTSSAPINLSCGTSTTNSVQFTWTVAAGATGYNISYTINGGSANNDATTGTSYTVNTLSPGDNVNMTVTPTGGSCYTSDNITCSATTAACGANAGTVKVFINSVDVTNASNEYVLCFGDDLDIVSDNNFTLPPAAGIDPTGLGYGFYTAAPVSIDPALDAGFSGLIDYHEDISDLNSSGPASPVFTAIGTSNPYFWIVPFTLDDQLNIANGGLDDSRGWDTDSDDCFDLGTPMKFTYLNQLTAAYDEDCSNGTSTITISGGSPELIAGTEYQISLSGAGTLSDTTLIVSGGSVSVSGLGSGDSYSLAIADDNGCSITVGNTSFVAGPSLSYVAVNPDCFGDGSGSIDLSITGGTGAISYDWSHDPLETAPDLAGLGAGTYVVTVTDISGCTDIASITIVEPQKISFITSFTDLTCFNDFTGFASVAASGGTQPYSYLWSSSETTASISSLNAGVYSVTLTDAHGCDTVTTVLLTQPDSILVSETIADAYCPESTDGSIGLIVNGGTAPYTYSWSSGIFAATADNLASGEYAVTVTDTHGCEETKTYSVSFINDVCLNIPDAFSPNADGVNDTWQIEGIENFENIRIQIFNRWGQLVFEFEGTGVAYNDSDAQWDGKVNDTELTTNSFIYMLDLMNGQQTYNGIVTIIKD
ncbi:MAG: hypothetical protein A2W93_05185 [Bacteroidetes bacterium GWF2_43_63]|nr:MAG: hypothetical protein A2W94_11965 [Bacteroidetes bacterium GWE2_42_42]OFY56269.1 MAG: hypothetical protein A2W93_05185 [Bacteroidetes bacterium GWF2_43_63]HBG71946.1 hypothetical protein [Bacteroidales bacterium]HCB61847.1 hypothetical protein [Bacteroidales bacterium]HCY23869.1 hypothetical protein [Bacteroidales bacterium]